MVRVALARLTPVVAAAFLAISCASSGPPASGSQAVPVVTDPSGATATADGGQTIRTPGSIIVPAGATVVEIVIEKDGFESETVVLLRAVRDSRAFKDCVDRSMLDPGSKPPNPGVTDAQVVGFAALGLLAHCSDPLPAPIEPGMVFVRLVPLPRLPVRRPTPPAED